MRDKGPTKVSVIDGDLNEMVLDLRAVLDRMMALPSMVAANTKMRRPWLEVKGNRRPGRATGTAWSDGSNRIILRIGEGCPAEVVEELILHEAAHVVLPEGEHHGPQFRVLLLAAAFERWPLLRGMILNKGRTYAIDDHIWHAARLLEPQARGQPEQVWHMDEPVLGKDSQVVGRIKSIRWTHRLPSVATDREVLHGRAGG